MPNCANMWCQVCNNAGRSPWVWRDEVGHWVCAHGAMCTDDDAPKTRPPVPAMWAEAWTYSDNRE